MVDIQEKRKYIRLNTVFPIEFQLVDREDRRPLSDLYEGFTRDVGKGGMGIFAKTLKDKNQGFFNFIPHETRLKVIINIPLDREPIESYATVEWIERQPGPLIDTYLFGISYDFINELEYEKIISYAKWLRLKPKLILSTIIILTVVSIFSIAAFFAINKRKLAGERELVKTAAESRRAKKAEIAAEKKVSDIETELDTIGKRQMAVEAAFEKLAEKKQTLEEISKLSEEDREELQLQLEELAREKVLLEERIEKELVEGEGVTEEKEVFEEEGAAQKVSAERLRSEEVNYNRFRELILNEKIQSLSAYVSSHRSSIYHAAGLFGLAELRYKDGEKTLAEVNYNQVIEMYPKSKYALYSSHRLEQLGRNYNYSQYSLKYFYDLYNLPDLFDYRNIEPYIK